MPKTDITTAPPVEIEVIDSRLGASAMRRGLRLLAALTLTAAIVVPVAAAATGAAPTVHRHHGKRLHRGKKGKSQPGRPKPTPTDPTQRLAALRTEAEALTRRIAAVKAADDTAAAAPKVVTAKPVQQSIEAASGPAGGALVGTYPVPTLAPRSVGHAAILPDAIGTGNFLPGSLTYKDFATGSITGPDFFPGTLDADRVNDGQISSAQISESFRWPPQTHGPNLSATLKPGAHSVRVTSTCPNETRMISGGFIWKNLAGRRTEILNSSPGSMFPGETDKTWEVVAKVESGGDENTITPVALCLE
jgi:hypothetical protein